MGDGTAGTGYSEGTGHIEGSNSVTFGAWLKQRRKAQGNVYSGANIKAVRHRHRHVCAKLQSNGSKAARRLLKMRRRKEVRFATHTNHVISKHIVATAKALNHGIATEDLGGIREKDPVRHSQRATLHSWSFYQLRSFIEYKAQLAGIKVQTVDPRNTSRMCPLCGCIDKANRVSQSKFLCASCGYAANADVNAAGNIARRATLGTKDVRARHTSRDLCIRCLVKEARIRFQGKAPGFIKGVAY